MCSGKLAGWISEHNLGAAHLFTWFYGVLNEIAEDPAYVPPVTPHQWWTREQNCQWQVHDVDHHIKIFLSCFERLD